MAQLERHKQVFEEIKRENEVLHSELEKLKKESEVTVVSAPLKALEEKVLNSAVNRETEYGASVIGEIVVSAAKNCNRLTSEPSAEKRELVNLILGRTEVAKAEILKIVSAEDTFESKKNSIIREKTAAEDYFQSVMAQI